MRTTSRDDYLMRLIQQMVQLMMHIAGLKQAGEFEEAQKEIDHATRTLLGPAADTLILLDPSTAAQILGDPDRVLTWATILCEQADVQRLQGRVPQADTTRGRALALAREAARRGVSDPSAAESLIEILLQAG